MGARWRGKGPTNAFGVPPNEVGFSGRGLMETLRVSRGPYLMNRPVRIGAVARVAMGPSVSRPRFRHANPIDL